MPPDPIPSPCKAQPPRSVSKVEIDADGGCRCTVEVDSGNGYPVAALLVPLALEGGTWRVVHDGHTVEHPGEADVAQPVQPLQAGSDLGAVPVALPWPAGAPRALLLLLHRQIGPIGSRNFDLRRPFPVRLPGDALPGDARPLPVEAARWRQEAARSVTTTAARPLPAEAAPATPPPFDDATARQAVLRFLGTATGDQIERGLIRNRAAAAPGGGP